MREGVGAAYEQWDGRGWPGTLKADAIPVAARIAQLAEFMEVAHRVGGVAGAITLARRRAGRQFDPALAALLCARAEDIFGGLETVPAWRAVIAAEPALAVELSPDQLDRALAAIANFVDLKSPFTLGHSVAVAELAEEAGAAARAAAGAGAGAAAGRVRARVRAAGRVELDLGPARAAERGRMGTDPDVPLPDRADAAPVGRAGPARRDRGAAPRAAGRQRVSARAVRRRDLPAGPVLGAADAYASMREPRPYRPARSAQEAAAEIHAEVRACRLDGPAADAVLEAAGHRLPRRREALAGLTAREVEVLILLARGLSNKQIAERLVITPKTAGNHVEHIYAKIDASSRAAAAMFAVQHGLLPEEKLTAPAPP